MCHRYCKWPEFVASCTTYQREDKICTFTVMMKVRAINLFKGLEIMCEKHTGREIIGQYTMKKENNRTLIGKIE